MRSALMLAALALAACDQSQPPKDRADNVVSSGAPIELSQEGAPSAPAPVQATAATPNPAEAEKHFQALGTEPFWSIDVLSGQLRYSSPEVEPTTFASTEMKVGKGARYTGTMNGQAISLLIAPGKCSDGMSDTVYQWKAALTIAGKTEHGCARAK